MSKAARRARKKANRAKRLSCEECGLLVDEGADGDHATCWSKGDWCWDGLVIVAWCPACGWDFAR